MALFVAPCLAFAATLGVDSAELVTDIAPGAKRVLKLNVTNSGKDSTPVTVYSEDWQITDGALDFNNQSHPRALGRRVTVSPASFELAPGTAQEVTVVVEAGAGPFEPGSYWSVVFVQSARLATLAAGPADRSTEMRIVQRIGVPIFADHLPEAKPLPGDVAITNIKSTANGISIRVNNPSAYMRMVTSASVSLTPLSGGQTIKNSLRSFRLLPGSSQEITVEMPAAAKGLGRCSVLAVLDYGAEDLVVGEARLTF